MNPSNGAVHWMEIFTSTETIIVVYYGIFDGFCMRCQNKTVVLVLSNLKQCFILSKKKLSEFIKFLTKFSWFFVLFLEIPETEWNKSVVFWQMVLQFTVIEVAGIHGCAFRWFFFCSFSFRVHIWHNVRLANVFQVFNAKHLHFFNSVKFGLWQEIYAKTSQKRSIIDP